MNFLIVSHAIHKDHRGEIYSYSPYVREMNLWLKYVDRCTVVAPSSEAPVSKIEMAYKHSDFRLKGVSPIQFTSLATSLCSLIKIPYLFIILFQEMRQADHIHLRCPGNMGLLGCLVQVFFPKTPKTAKYAGNWDPQSKQPLSYRFQKWILSNTFFTKNMQVLVYGDWESRSANIKPFFTASFPAAEKIKPLKRDYTQTLHFLFVGSLVSGKRPLYSIQLIKQLHHLGYQVTLDVYGDGVLRAELQDYINQKQLEKIVTLHGNQDLDIIKGQLQSAHFLLLPSKSEGWPKAVAEAMFFGTIPIATPVSCVPYMLDKGNRGLLISGNIKEDIKQIITALKNHDCLLDKADRAAAWSQTYTIERFEEEIMKLVT